MSAPFPPLLTPMVTFDTNGGPKGIATPHWATYFNLVAASVTPIDALPDALPASTLVGRGADGGDGAAELLTLGAGLTLVGTELSAPAVAVTPFANLGLTVLDTSSLFALTWKPGSALTAARTFTLTTGDADRTLMLSGNPTLGDWFDQSVKAAASPSFAGLTVNAFALTVNGAPTLDDWFNQSVKTTASPTFANATVTTLVTSATVNATAAYKINNVAGVSGNFNLALDGGGAVQLVVDNGIVTTYA